MDAFWFSLIAIPGGIVLTVVLTIIAVQWLEDIEESDRR